MFTKFKITKPDNVREKRKKKEDNYGITITSALSHKICTFDNPMRLVACSRNTHRLFNDSKSVISHSKMQSKLSRTKNNLSKQKH